MKFNLKNRPRMGETHGWDDMIEASTEWFEGFEKGLREKLVYPTNTKSIPVYNFVKEILGE